MKKIHKKQPTSLMGALKGKIKTKGDITSTGSKWHALTRNKQIKKSKNG